MLASPTGPSQRPVARTAPVQSGEITSRTLRVEFPPELEASFPARLLFLALRLGSPSVGADAEQSRTEETLVAQKSLPAEGIFIEA